MATVTAVGNAINMNGNVLSDLATASAAATDWTSTPTTFTATAHDGSVAIHGTGPSFSNYGIGAELASGKIASLSIEYGPASPHVAYTITGVPGLSVNELATLPPATSLAIMLAGGDNLFGSQYADVLKGFDSGDFLDGGGGNDILDGGDGGDTLYGGAGRDHLFGGNHNDTLDGGAGLDVLDGGSGNDTVTYATAKHGVSVQLHGSTLANLKINGVVEDQLKNIETIEGGKAGDHLAGDGHGNSLTGNGGADHLSGGGGVDELIGGNGNDVLSGGAGGDILWGGNGKDIMTGGNGNDAFYFAGPLIRGKFDMITDFAPGHDHITLSEWTFTQVHFQRIRQPELLRHRCCSQRP